MTETILIVDDSTFIVDGLVALLKKKYHPVPCSSGEECLSFLSTKLPSLIILDIMMEPMDGWETLSRIKADKRSRHVPVLMFSAKKISPEEAETHRIIIDDFISKPVNPQKLIEAIEKVLARQAFNRQVLAQWTAAGVSPVVIDQYLSLKMNLDVDLSILCVMQKQLDIASAGSVNREEIARSIATIEERIASTRALIGTFCQEQGNTLPVIVQDAAVTAREKSIQLLPQPAENTISSPAAAPVFLQEPESGALPLSPAIGASPAEPLPDSPSSPVLPARDIPGSASRPLYFLPISSDQQEIPSDSQAVFLPDTTIDARKSAPQPVIPETSPGPEMAGSFPEKSDQISTGAGQQGVSPETAADLFEPFSPQKGLGLQEDHLLPASERDETKKPETPLPQRSLKPSSLQLPGSGTATPPMLGGSSRRRFEPAESGRSGHPDAGKSPGDDGIISRIFTAIIGFFRGRTR